ncbi:hypothetical protein HDA40_001960 [Hamadaea flava]|nr:hypothetical protein [Hamadaea flava]
MPDLYTVLGAVILDDKEDERPQPTTVLTASVETIDNDFVGALAQAITV